METNIERVPDGELTEVERYLLTQAGYTDFEISAVETSILGIHLGDDECYRPESRLKEPTPGAPHPLVSLRALWTERLAAISDSDEPSDDPSEPLDDFTHADDIREAEGLAGILREYRDFFVCIEDTNFAYRDWRQLAYAFLEMELTPLPTQEEIEATCGPTGIDLPSVVIDGDHYFDFAFIVKSSTEKRRRARELKQVREEVLRYLVGNRVERWE